MTSTSHTLTNLPPSFANNTNSEAMGVKSSNYLLENLDASKRFQFIQPKVDLFDSAISQTKSLLDQYASQISEKQAARIKEDRKRKRSGADIPYGDILKVRKVHTQGFAVEQVWEQARRVIDALREEVQREVEELDLVVPDDSEDKDDIENDDDIDADTQLDNDDEDSDEAQELMDEDDNEAEIIEDEDEDEDIDGGDVEDMLHELEGDDDYENEEEDDENGGVFVPDPHGLNDGFFSIDDFNKQTEFLEQQDAQADPYTGEASDEEEIDWDVDPMANAQKSKVSSDRRAKAMDVEKDEDEDDDEDEEGGPTFGNVDLNAPEGDSGDEDADMDDAVDVGAGDNTNEILYKDFFEPPPRKIGKGERQEDYLARQARRKQQEPAEDAEAEMERAIKNVRRDLFDDEDEEMSEDALSDVDPGDPRSRKSAHERRQAKLAEEIRRLEAASVAKREWTLSGEARAADRPLNSLLEEDLDFERTGKPVPVITAEVSESIEELIKRRIIAQEFDEVIRRRPEDGVQSGTRRGQFELDDSKPQQSLAEMYEEEHVKNQDPDAYMSKADERLKKQHQEIEGLWKEISGKLDALSSWHYKPKPAAPSLTVVADVATINMEDAQPTTAGGVAGGESMLAPQEIYKAGKEKDTLRRGEVIAGGAPIARQEMSREEKLRRRRREKERIRKRGGEELDNKPQSKKSKQQKETMDELKRGGVKVIGNKGEIRDVEGNKIKEAAAVSAGGFKL